MISRGLFTQILMIVLAVGIAISYIKPEFDKIRQTQDDLVEYKEERQKVDQVNSELAAFIEQINNVPSADQNKLVTYIPDQVDPVAVSRIIQIITNQSGVLLLDVSYDGLEEQSIESLAQSANLNFPFAHSFTLEIQGTYEQVKSTLSLFEQNVFPLEVHALEISVLEGDFVSASVSLVTYSHQVPEPSEFGNN